MTFQDFQRDEQLLDQVAKETIGPNVKVKEPGKFRQFLNYISNLGDVEPTVSIPQYGPPQRTQDAGINFFGEGGVVNPSREDLRDFGLGLAEFGTYLVPGGEAVRQLPVGGGERLYEAGEVLTPLIDPTVARQYGAQFGSEIPEGVPFVGGMTGLEATLGGAAALTSPLDLGTTILTAGAGPAVLGNLGTGIVPRTIRTFAEPVAGGPFGRRLAAETAVQLPAATAISGVEQRQQEGIAQPFENTFTALLAGALPTAAGVGLLGRSLARQNQPLDVPNILRPREVDQPFIQESIFPSYGTAPTQPRMRVSISPSVTGEADQPATRLFPQQYVDKQNEIKKIFQESGVTPRNRLFSELSALNANAGIFIENENRGLQNLERGFSDLRIAPGVGQYFNEIEPSIDMIVTNPANSDLSVARIVDIADKDLNQKEIIITNRITQDDLRPVRAPMGTARNPLEDLPIGEVIEPGVTRDFSTVYTFTNRLTDDDLQAITQLANENGFAGFTVSGDFQSLEYFTVRKYNPNYGEESDKIIDFEQLINDYFRRTGRQNATEARPTAIRTRVVSQESGAFTQSYTEYKNQNADRINQILEGQGIRGAVDPDGSIDFQQLRQARPLTSEQINQPTRLGAFGERQRGLMLGSDGTDIPEDIFKNLPKNLIDDKEFVFRLQYVTDAEKEFLRPFLDRANARAKRGEARVLTDSEIGFIKRRFLARTNSRINEDFRPWETGNVQPRQVSPQEIGDFLRDVITFIPNRVRRSEFFESFLKLTDKVPDIKSIDIQRLRRFFGKDSELVDTLEKIDKQPNQNKKKLDYSLISNVMFLGKAIRGTMDLGAFLRQAVVYTVTRPRAALPAFKTGLKAMMSEDSLRQSDALIEQDKDFDMFVNVGGMRFNRIGADSVADQRAEAFMSSFIDKLPTWTGIGPILRGSARFHTSFLNNVRFNVMKQLIPEGAFNQGGKFANFTSQADVEDVYKQAGEIVNVFTGEADLSDVFTNRTFRSFLYNFMWSPRLWYSRFAMPFYVFKNDKMRNEAVKDLAKFFGTGLTILYLANMRNDVKVNIRKGEIAFEDGTRFRIWGGFEQTWNYLFDMLRDYKTSSTGTKYKVGDPKNPLNRMLVQTLRFARGKANPVVGEVIDHATGKDFFGEDVFERYETDTIFNINSRNPFIQSLSPLIIAEIFELIENTDDPFMIGLGIVGATLGTGVSSYKSKREAGLDVYGKEFVELEPFEQRISNLHFYADDTTRSVPSSYVSLSELNQAIQAIPKEKSYDRNQKIRAYFNAKATSANDRKMEAAESGFDFEDPFYKNQIRFAGTDRERVALEAYFDLVEQNTTGDGLLLYDAFDSARDKFYRTLSKKEKQYIARNTNYHAETIPPELFRILPRSERTKLQESINARAQMDRSILKPLDEQITETFNRLADKIESQED